MCVCALLSGGDSWLFLPPSQRGCDDWSVTSLSPPCPLYAPPLSTTPTAWPALLLCLRASLSLDPHCIWVWSAMETCSAQLEAAASWASPPFFQPSSLALPHPSLFLSSAFTLQHPTIRSLSHARNHAKLMGTLSLARGWKQRFVTHLLSVDAVHTPIPFAHTKTDRHKCTPWQGVHSLPCQMLRFVSGLTSCLEHVGVENKGMVSSPYLCGSTLVRITLLNSLAPGQGCWKN